jgi:hypothetical protein
MEVHLFSLRCKRMTHDFPGGFHLDVPVTADEHRLGVPTLSIHGRKFPFVKNVYFMSWCTPGSSDFLRA